VAIERLRQVFIAVTDMAGQIDFFRDALGLELQFRDGDEWAQFSAGEVSVALAGPRESLGAPRGASVPVFQTDDLDALRESISRAGGDCADVRDMGDHGRTCLFRDTTGAVMAALEKKGK